MKKGLLFVTMMGLVFALSSCSENTDVLQAAKEMSVVSVSEEEVSKTPFIPESNIQEISKIEFSGVQYDKPYQTLQECIDHSESIKNMIEALSNEENENIDSKVLVENDTKLVFERTLKENTVYSDTFAEDTEKSLEEKKADFVEVVNLFEWGVDNDNITVVVRYKDKDGNVIFEKEFDNEEA